MNLPLTKRTPGWAQLSPAPAALQQHQARREADPNADLRPVQELQVGLGGCSVGKVDKSGEGLAFFQKLGSGLSRDIFFGLAWVGGGVL